MRHQRIGYYVHHHGTGHLHRASVLAAELTRRGVETTGLSSLPRPGTWTGDWVRLSRDDEPPPGPDADAAAGGLLHWAPRGHDGLSRRAARISGWLAEARPDLVVSDVSQEVSILTRLHGVAVVSVLLPGHRPDPAHALGLGLSDDVVGFWPPGSSLSSTGLPPAVAGRVRELGALSRFGPCETPGPRGGRRGVVLAGSGGGYEVLERAAAALALALPSWTWLLLGPGSWVADPWQHLCAADVVVTHGGQNAVAEVAAARVPALVVPLARPFGEQEATGAALRAARYPVRVVDDPVGADWVALVADVVGLDGRAWAGWADGGAAARFGDLVLGRLGAAGQVAS